MPKIVTQTKRATSGPKPGGTPAATTPADAAKPAARRRTQAERSEQTREQILQTSAKLLRAKGIGGLRTSEVAELAGVSQGAQFHHFPTKEDLIVAALEYVEQKSLKTSRRRAATRGANDDPIASITKDARDYYFSDHFFLELAVGLTAESDSRMISTVRKKTRESRIAVEKAWLEVLKQSGLPAELAADLLALTLSVVRGLAVRQLIIPEPKRSRKLTALWHDIVRTYLESIATR